MIYLFWPRNQPFHISHIDPSTQETQVMHPYHFIDIFMLFPYILTSFFEKYQWISWKIFFDDRSYPRQETDPCYILLKDMPTILSIEVNHNIGSDVSASTLEECNFRKKVQIITVSDSEVQTRIPAGRIRDIRNDIQNEDHYHDRLYFQWYWSTPGRPRASDGRDLESTVTLEPRTSTQCWPYYFGPEQCSDRENHTYCTPTLGRLEKTLLQWSTDTMNWEDRLQYESFCKAYFQELEPRHDIL